MNAIVFDPVIDYKATNELEQKILKVLKNNHSSVDINMLLRELDEDHTRYSFIKETVWRLISSGDIVLTPERKLTIPK